MCAPEPSARATFSALAVEGVYGSKSWKSRRRPSRDQAGCIASPTSFRSPEPSAFTVQMSVDGHQRTISGSQRLRFQTMNASRFPFGDQTGRSFSPSLKVSCRCPLPSAFISQI